MCDFTYGGNLSIVGISVSWESQCPQGSLPQMIQQMSRDNAPPLPTIPQMSEGPEGGNRRVSMKDGYGTLLKSYA
jgi:hypothetical protein